MYAELRDSGAFEAILRIVRHVDTAHEVRIVYKTFLICIYVYIL